MSKKDDLKKKKKDKKKNGSGESGKAVRAVDKMMSELVAKAKDAKMAKKHKEAKDPKRFAKIGCDEVLPEMRETIADVEMLGESAYGRYLYAVRSTEALAKDIKSAVKAASEAEGGDFLKPTVSKAKGGSTVLRVPIAVPLLGGAGHGDGEAPHSGAKSSTDGLSFSDFVAELLECGADRTMKAADKVSVPHDFLYKVRGCAMEPISATYPVAEVVSRFGLYGADAEGEPSLLPLLPHERVPKLRESEFSARYGEKAVKRMEKARKKYGVLGEADGEPLYADIDAAEERVRECRDAPCGGGYKALRFRMACAAYRDVEEMLAVYAGLADDAENDWRFRLALFSQLGLQLAIADYICEEALGEDLCRMGKNVRGTKEQALREAQTRAWIDETVSLAFALIGAFGKPALR